MKILVLTIIIVAYFNSQLCLSENAKGLYEDTEKKLLEFKEKINKTVDGAILTLRLAQVFFDEEQEEKLNNSKILIQKTASKYITDYNEWIQKAKNLNINPGNCTKDWLQIEFFIPRAASQNISDSYTEKVTPLIVKWVNLSQNLRHIPEIVKDIEKKFYSCDKNDEDCIKKVADLIDGNQVLFKQIQKIVVEIEGILEKILQILDECIERSIKSLDIKEKELTGKGIECIKKLINGI